MEQITYIKTDNYYIPDWKLPEEHRPIGRWGRMHRDYLREYRPVVFNQLVLSGNLWTYLADINEQAQQRMDAMVKQMMAYEGVTEELKEKSQMEWVRRINNIQNQAEEVIQNQLIYKQHLLLLLCDAPKQSVLSLFSKSKSPGSLRKRKEPGLQQRFQETQ